MIDCACATTTSGTRGRDSGRGARRNRWRCPGRCAGACPSRESRTRSAPPSLSQLQPQWPPLGLPLSTRIWLISAKWRGWSGKMFKSILCNTQNYQLSSRNISHFIESHWDEVLSYHLWYKHILFIVVHAEAFTYKTLFRLVRFVACERYIKWFDS